MNQTQTRTCRHRLAMTLVVAWGMALPFWAGSPSPAMADEAAIRQANSLSSAFRAAAKKVLPTVVKIRTTTKPQPRQELRGQGNPFKGTPFEDFFDEDVPGFRFRGPMPRQGGVGSGVIVDPAGIIITNNHVVDNADDVTIELSDGRRFKATDIKRDKKTDLAVVRIEADEPLPAAKLGDSDQLAIGDWVLAVGTPFELDQTVSAGIISAKGRTLGNSSRAKYLQTDAAINPGNSGGPLVNLNGEVIGINTAIASRSGGYQGIGFAITSNVAKWVTRQLIESGNVQRAYLGVGIMKITGDLAEKLGVRPGQGVLISEVFEGSPAAEAGLQEGDLVLTFAGKKVGSPIQLQEAVERCPFGSKQNVEIRRDGRALTLKVVVKPLPKDFGVASRGSSGPGRKDSPPSYTSEALGLEVADLTPEVAKQLGYKGSAGVVVTEVDPAGIAAEAGLREGTLILHVGRTPVSSVDEFKAAMEKQSLKDGVMLLVRIGGGNRYLVLKRS